jgi:hypothetical protein
LLRQDDYQKAKLVTVGWQHGNVYGGHQASCIIMSVLANRVRAGWGTWMDVIDNIPKFAAIKEMPTGSPQIWEPNFVRLLHEVDGIYDGSINYAQSKGNTGTPVSAFYWADLRTIETDFFKDKILAYPELHPRIGDMNSLTMFK